MNETPNIFNRRLYRRRRANAARVFGAHDFLHRRAMEDVVDRLETVTRDFPLALFYGADPLLSMVTPACGVGRFLSADMAQERVGSGEPGLVFDEEATPLAEGRLDLIVSLLTLHAVNDPVGALVQMRRALKPDGLLVAVAFGEDTLSSLRAAFYAAEASTTGAVSVRVSPFAGVRSWGTALQRAGFALPVADLDRVRIEYRSPARLFADLRGMGETSCLTARGRGIKKATAARLLEDLGPAPEITFDLVTMTGWAPDESQPKPLRPGSAKQSLAKAVNSGDGGDN